MLLLLTMLVYPSRRRRRTTHGLLSCICILSLFFTLLVLLSVCLFFYFIFSWKSCCFNYNMYSRTGCFGCHCNRVQSGASGNGNNNNMVRVSMAGCKTKPEWDFGDGGVPRKCATLCPNAVCAALLRIESLNLIWDWQRWDRWKGYQYQGFVSINWSECIIVGYSKSFVPSLIWRKLIICMSKFRPRKK